MRLKLIDNVDLKAATGQIWADNPERLLCYEGMKYTYFEKQVANYHRGRWLGETLLSITVTS